MNDSVDIILQQWQTERPDLDPSPMGIIGRISKLEQHFAIALQNTFANFGLQRGDFDVLATLRRNGEPYSLTPTQLYQSMMLTSGAMTNRLDRLEQLEFITRQANPNDRRGLLIVLSKKGKNLIEKAMTAHIASETNLLECLSQQERHQLAKILRKLLLNFEN